MYQNMYVEGGDTVQKSKSLKAILLCAVLIFAGISGCGGKDNGAASADYEYSDYVFDNDEAQYYMSNNAAAAETGYYYIANAPVYTTSYNFLYYFDMVNKNSMPLCAKLNCEHDDENCDAYLSAEECLSSNIWYYNQRIYMIERSDEKDRLVSYNKTGRDKKNVADLSVDGRSVIQSQDRACVSHGKLYYMLAGEKSQFLYEVPLTGTDTPRLIKEYTSEYEIRETLTLYAIEDRVYITLVSGITSDTNNYIIECLDISDGEPVRMFDYMADGASISGEIDGWEIQACYDAEGNFYFTSISDEAYFVNKLNLETKENTEIYRIDISEDTGSREDYIDLCGFDGKYLYVYESVDFSVKENRQNYELGNYLYIIDTEGKLADTIMLTKNTEYAEENNVSTNSPGVSVSLKGGDSRYMLVTFRDYCVRGIEMSQEDIDKYKEEYTKGISQMKMPDVCVAGVLDKKQIGTGEFEWINITP